jgi:putative flippase GtrA
MKQTAGQFIRFALVGCAGFVVDAAVLSLAIYVLHIGPYYGRLLSYLVAATSTWYLNRCFTFPDSDKQAIHRQWGKFLMVNGLGGLVNLGVYTLLVSGITGIAVHPILAVAFGSIAGLAFNFTASRHFVFRKTAA